MINLTIDGKLVTVPEGATILDAADALGIVIPTLCFLKEMSPLTSCMVCVVKVGGRRNLLPACATKAEEGMVVFSDHPEVTKARRTALELLLSDHVGDCMGPCQVACPAGMDIPQMLRYMSEGRYDKAIETIKQDLALPAVTGYICPAPCEKACRRGQVDQVIAVRSAKRCAAELDLAETYPYRPDIPRKSDKKVAIVGGGPAGLAAAYYLQREGISCTLFDDRIEPGGMLRYGVPEQDLPRSVLDAEIEQIRGLGVVFKQQVRVGRDIPFEEIRNAFDAVFLGIGKASPDDLELLGFGKGNKTLAVDQNTFQTDIPGVFAGGDVRRGQKLTVRSLADGKKAAKSISRFLNDESVAGTMRPFNTRMGKLEPRELELFSGPSGNRAGSIERTKAADRSKPLDKAQASSEAAFCLHCDCRKATSCKLRIFSREYEAKASHYSGKSRSFIRQDDHPDLIYEPGKCISCGICVRITERQREKLGLTFIGRGFDVKVAVPFDKSMLEGLAGPVDKIVTACPTGALAFKEKPDRSKNYITTKHEEHEE